mmetsp:Transcript_20159/g.56145  ORF Transcript_20159/g.56145 Transcript_20159/m.56145 type:complete len:202 (-) Transcript_20159:1265-1870(-)
MAQGRWCPWTATLHRARCWSSRCAPFSTWSTMMYGRCLAKAGTHASRASTSAPSRPSSARPATSSGASACGTSRRGCTSRGAWATCAGWCSACWLSWAFPTPSSASQTHPPWRSSATSTTARCCCASSSTGLRCSCGSSEGSSPCCASTASCYGLVVACLPSSMTSSRKMGSLWTHTLRASLMVWQRTATCAPPTTSTTTA